MQGQFIGSRQGKLKCCCTKSELNYAAVLIVKHWDKKKKKAQLFQVIGTEKTLIMATRKLHLYKSKFHKSFLLKVKFFNKKYTENNRKGVG